jgi:type VI secretion system protein ImpG
MRETLLPVYERELRYIRRLAEEFAERYPAVAGRLLLEPDKCEDPHVERLIESFAMLTARVQRRIDDEFPEISDSFLGVLAPHVLAPIPSMTIVQFALDPEQGKTGRSIEVERGALLHTKPVEGVRCRFRTTAPLSLWPVRVEAAEIVSLNEREPGVPPGVRAAIRLHLKSAAGVPFARLALDRLQFFLDGDAAIVHRVYELMFRSPRGVLLRAAGGARTGSDAVAFLEPACLVPGGLDPQEETLPVPPQSPRGLLLVQEYFGFQDKFLFAAIAGLLPVLSRFAVEEIEALVLLDEFPADLAGKLSPAHFKLGCVPAVNLFPMETEPTTLKHDATEIPILPDVHAPYSYEVHSILEVSTTSPTTGTKEYRPFYAFGHADTDADDVAFYHATRRASLRKDDSGTEVELTLVDRRFDPWTTTGDEVLSVRALCSNRDLPSRLGFGDAQGDFRIEGKPGIASIRCLRKPTAPIRAPHRADSRWKLASLLCLNHLSIVGTVADSRAEAAAAPGAEGDQTPSLEALREILRTNDFAESAVSRQRIGGILGIRARRVLRRVEAGGWLAPARGLEVEITFDEERFAGSSAFLFATVLERFFALYAPINSFVQVVAVSRQREGVLKRWPPRAGQRPLL